MNRREFFTFGVLPALFGKGGESAIPPEKDKQVNVVIEIDKKWLADIVVPEIPKARLYGLR